MKLNDNTVLITGGANGIGLELAKKLLVLNNKIIVCDKDELKLSKLKEELKDINTIKCDIRNKNDIKSLCEFVNINFNDLNVIINNAGVQTDINFLNDEFIDFNEIDTNLSGNINLTKSLLPTIIKNNSPTLINITSQLAFFPIAKMPIYSATKSALHTLTKCLRHQLKDIVNVIEIIPPTVDTNINPEGRKNSIFKFKLDVRTYIDDVIKKLSSNISEIYYEGNSEMINNSTKKDFDFMFESFNR